MITKEQLEIFNQHFKIIETTNEISTHQTFLDLDDLKNFIKNDMHDYLKGNN